MNHVARSAAVTAVVNRLLKRENHLHHQVPQLMLRYKQHRALVNVNLLEDVTCHLSIL